MRMNMVVKKTWLTGDVAMFVLDESYVIAFWDLFVFVYIIKWGLVGKYIYICSRGMTTMW